MQTQMKNIPYRVQKGNRPGIEEIIDNCIYGVIRENAKSFIAWLKVNGVAFQKHASTTRQHYATYKNQRLMQIGFWDERVDFNHVGNHHEGDPQYWAVSWCLPVREGDDSAYNTEMAAIAWDFNMCGQCKPDKTCDGIINGELKGVKKSFFGREYDGLCIHSHLRIKNPGNSVIESIKKLVLQSISEIDGYAGNKSLTVSENRITFDLKPYKKKYISLSFTAQVKREAARGDLLWQLNDTDYTVVSEIIHNAENGIYHAMRGEWAGYVHKHDSMLYLNTWGNGNNEKPVYAIKDFEIEITQEYLGDYYKALIIPAVSGAFKVAEPFIHDLPHDELLAGINAFRTFLYDFHEKINSEYKNYSAKQRELFAKYAPSVLLLIGIHGKLETKRRKELTVYASDLFIIPKPSHSKYMNLERVSAKNIAEIFEFLSEMGFYFEELNHSEKVNLNETGQFYVTHENDENIIIGLKLLAEAAVNITSGYLDIDWGFMRCSHYPLASAETVEDTLCFNDFIPMLTLKQRDWALDLHKLLMDNNCTLVSEGKDYATFSYYPQKVENWRWACVWEFRPYGLVIKMNTRHIKNLDGIAQALPQGMMGVLQSGGCGCRNKCSPDFYKIKHGNNNYLDCKNYGWYFSLTSPEEYKILKEWIKTELAAKIVK
jgi:hypothetical protein